MRRLLSITILSVFTISGLFAQTVSLLNEGMSDALRRAQLWGTVSSTSSSFCVRPVHATRALGIKDSYRYSPLLDVYDATTDSAGHPLRYDYKNWIRVQAVPIVSRIQYNSHHDYGWNDGPMIPNKGLQLYLNTGIYGTLANGIIEFQYAPEIVFAANQDLLAPGVRSSLGDFPDRFGTDPYTRTYSGQSYIKLNVDFLSIGFSSENVAWGPGRFTNVIMSQNAPGMKHFTVHSNKPLKTPIGSFEGQMLTGNMMHSGFRYNAGPSGSGNLDPVYFVPGLDSTFRAFAGIVGVFSPSILPGFSIGVTRVLYTAQAVQNASYADYIKLFFTNPFRGAGGGTQVGIDQLASGFVRYVLPESHAEFYGEYGFDDNRYDLEDMLVSPEHSRGYMFGVRKLQPVDGWKHYWDFSYEMGQYEGSKELMNRNVPALGYAVFYNSDYSHRGQNLGAGIGSGSNQWIFNLDRVKDGQRLGFTYERIARNNDMLYVGRVPWVLTGYGFDITKKYIESSVGLNYSVRLGPSLIWVKALMTHTYNWNYWYNPGGGGDDMRSFGYEVNSLNVFTGMSLSL
jgi:hypothetical protein